ncbi:hypothetical protein EVAR_39479_1 [Eumeta japonica]|uniref:Uncharacterized protein n=1 Tax=Eumeta variegata TaxID=151549 RepID=A0A4C1W0T9_EUMVA|nr:hypothetical protein EVAR_39479_1 [Eumeta japonica]
MRNLIYDHMGGDAGNGCRPILRSNETKKLLRVDRAIKRRRGRGRGAGDVQKHNLKYPLASYRMRGRGRAPPGRRMSADTRVPAPASAPAGSRRRRPRRLARDRLIRTTSTPGDLCGDSFV